MSSVPDENPVSPVCHSSPHGQIHCGTMESGTTAAMCELLGRRWVGVEKDETYCRAAMERVAAARCAN